MLGIHRPPTTRSLLVSTTLTDIDVKRPLVPEEHFRGFFLKSWKAHSYSALLSEAVLERVKSVLTLVFVVRTCLMLQVATGCAGGHLRQPVLNDVRDLSLPGGPHGYADFTVSIRLRDQHLVLPYDGVHLQLQSGEPEW